MTLADDTAGTSRLMDRVERLEEVALTMGDGDERRETLLQIAAEALREAAPVRASVAADLLHMNEKTVRAWHRAGVLTSVRDKPRLMLDLPRLHEVLHLVRDIRTAGRTKGLLDEVHRRLIDAHWHDDPELQLSLEQMQAGHGIPA